MVDRQNEYFDEDPDGPPWQNAVKSTHENNVNPCTGQAWKNITETPKFKSSPIISRKHKVMFCPAGKVGSTFFTRLMISLNQHPLQKEVASPFTIPVENISRMVDNLDKLQDKPKLTFLRNSERLVFGRDPYRRIFSAWIDKLFSPNPFYWRNWGKRALGISTSVENRHRTACASDVTFGQFVGLVVAREGLYKHDFHLRPVADECNICKLRYTLLGKIETVSSDLDLLASRINVTMSFFRGAEYERESDLDNVLDSVKSAFAWRKDIARCGVSMEQMGHRIWRKLQIRGVIDSSLTYPFRRGDLDMNTTASMFITACLDAMKKSKDTRRLRKQKEIALFEAYTQVAPKLLEKIIEFYQDDFTIFGYDQRPDIIYERKHQRSKVYGCFDWEKEWVS